MAFCLPSLIMAQYQLVLENPNALKRKRIYVGDEFGVRVKGMDQIYVGELRAVKDSLIFMFGDSLDPATFDRIHIPRGKTGINMLRGSLIMTSVLYPVMMLINLPKSQWTVNKAMTVAGVSAGALVLSRVLKVFYWRRYRVGGDKWRIRIMPTVEGW
ncbi:MAG: hypothetical protein U0176_10985 [Bacteroidia bacterium]